MDRIELSQRWKYCSIYLLQIIWYTTGFKAGQEENTDHAMSKVNKRFR